MVNLCVVPGLDCAAVAKHSGGGAVASINLQFSIQAGNFKGINLDFRRADKQLLHVIFSTTWPG